MYTSGWPKNQNKCWYKMGSPPPVGSKKAVFRLRSVRSIVMAPARTGRASRSNRTVMPTDQINKGTRSSCIPAERMFMIVVIKFSAPRIDETPARCSEKIARSTEGPAWAILLERGGYTVHPVPAPFSTVAEARSMVRAGGSSQNLMLFRRGKAISGAPNIRGINQLPNPPIITGMTKKKIIRNACAVTIVLYSWSLPRRDPGWPNSARISILIDVPNRPDQIPNRKYKVPMSLWFVE